MAESYRKRNFMNKYEMWYIALYEFSGNTAEILKVF